MAAVETLWKGVHRVRGHSTPLTIGIDSKRARCAHILARTCCHYGSRFAISCGFHYFEVNFWNHYECHSEYHNVVPFQIFAHCDCPAFVVEEADFHGFAPTSF